ncbi:uncharacterized protein LOC110254869 [Exaiptasia diaphana]|uniref:Uncharacterized protein n=1 Tax=Exaiptasia diaphana TaxID=2652724 RepID=A0A913YA85_EXADI|nr:uncharacterized protein LOC110254869 [Exaiptasia diaphana]
MTINTLWTVDSVNVLTHSIPTNTEVQRWPHLHDVSLSDFQNKEVKMIIGSNVPEAFWVLEERRGKVGEPYAIRSPLGWTILGPTKSSTKDESLTSSFVKLQDDERRESKDDLLNQVQRFWEMDHVVSTSDRVMSRQDKHAIKTMESSVKLKDGHYEVALPWRQEIPYLPDNRSLAEQRLKLLKKRFLADNELFLKYKGTMNDYIDKGHARRVPENEVEVKGKPVLYLPHHPVFNPNKPNKTRVVFDCSAKYRNTSLNDQLLSGPDLTNSIVATEMDKALRRELEIPIDESFWTDSTSVLQYIRNTTTRFHTFVANRLTVIHDHTESYQWRYVPTNLNPADDASRGIAVKDLCHSNWLHGPDFLAEDKALWPAEPHALTSNCLDKDPEVKAHPAQSMTSIIQVTDDDAIVKLIEGYSSWNRLKQAVAWLLKL